ncbi:bifunctional phosphoribosylaminoimidazolecarboxamide formyltransferase/IMP cyclohydrolase [Buchnera aphidicola]|uniref:bifunctional phosphoribosylaminoimidazolecarboxamide formyltransferase/IMP cyclohydrolase n=1 Tax=Buchnera aphidicola TaxID=9 RepID=UPI0034643794
MKTNKNALISVFDKTNILIIALELKKNNFTIFATENTYLYLIKNNIKAKKLSQYINFPEIMNGKVKTLHPKILGGILYNYHLDHLDIKEHKIILFSIVIINFYPFNNKKLNLHTQSSQENVLNNIDIGGPALVRAAAKNYNNVVILTDYNDYHLIIKILQNNDNKDNIFKCERRLMKIFAEKAFKYTCLYDYSIYEYFFSRINKKSFSDTILINVNKKNNLRYGENLHQQAALYAANNYNTNTQSIIGCSQIQGKQLSYNNILDADVALECIKEFNFTTCVIVKHGNPCSVALRNSALESYYSAYSNDPISSFGGVIALNQKIDLILAQYIIDNQFVEVIIAPDIDLKARELFNLKPNIRLLICGYDDNNNSSEHVDNQPSYHLKQINNGLLIQSTDSIISNKDIANWETVSYKKPSKEEIEDCVFALKVSKFVKSNSIVYVQNQQTLAIGGGQTSRIDAVGIANYKLNKNNNVLHNKHLIMSSDAFFPFKDSVESAFLNGISCIIQPGGSIRDQEVINTVNKYGMKMIFTHKRYFKH